MRILVLVGLMLVAMLVAQAATVLMSSIGVDLTSRVGLLTVQAFVQILSMAVPVVLFVWIYYGTGWRDYCKVQAGGKQWGMAAVGMVLMLLVVPLTEVLTQWNDGWQMGRVGEAMRRMQEQTEALMDTMVKVDSIGGLLGNLLVVAVIPAVCEELLFRVGIQNQMQAWVKNRHLAVWITAIIFSLGHGEMFAFMPRLLLGAVLGYLYVYSNSLLVNTMAHFFNNACVVLLYWLAERGAIGIDPSVPMQFGWLTTLGCTLAAVMLFMVTFISDKRVKN